MYAANESANNEQRPMFIMTLELEDGNTEQIVIFKDSDPETIATTFCNQHNLKVNYVKYLKEKIQSLLSVNVINEEDEAEGQIEDAHNEADLAKNNEDNNDVLQRQDENYNNHNEDRSNARKESECDAKVLNDCIINDKPNTLEQMNSEQNKQQFNLTNSNTSHNANNEFHENEPIELEVDNYIGTNINDNVNNNMPNANHINNKYDLSNEENSTSNNQPTNNNNIIPSRDNSQPHQPSLSDTEQLNTIINVNNTNDTPHSQSTINKYKECLNELQKQNPAEQMHAHNLHKNKIPSLNTSSTPKTPEKDVKPKRPSKPKINSNYTLDLNVFDKQKSKNIIETHNHAFHPIEHEERKCRSKPNTPYSISTNNPSSLNSINVFDRNYNYANHYKQNRIKLSSMYNSTVFRYQQNQTNPSALLTLNTNKIITRVQSEAFSNLFKLLDSDDDGFISAMHMNTKQLSPDIYRMLEPIINEIKEEQCKLNEHEFINVMFNLYVDINYYDKHLLINTFKHKPITHHTHCNHNHKHLRPCHHRTLHTTHSNTKHRDTQGLTHKCVHVNKTNTFNKSSQLRYSFQPSINANASRLAKKHDDKQHRLYVQYLSTYSNILNTTNSRHSR